MYIRQTHPLKIELLKVNIKHALYDTFMALTLLIITNNGGQRVVRRIEN